jgi:hypothetical protein
MAFHYLPAKGWTSTLVLAVLVFVVYKLNGRPQLSGDAFPATLIPVEILRGDGPFLDRYRPLLFKMERGQPYYAACSHGHLVSCYPPGSLLAYLALDWPLKRLRDLCGPGWDSDPRWTLIPALYMAKDAAALIAAVTVALLHRLLLRLGLARFALTASVAAGLGSSLWMVASQAAWQHGPAALALVAALLSLSSGALSRGRLLVAGFWAALLVTIRPIDLPFSVAIALWVLRYHRQAMAWFLPFPLVLGGLFLVHNFYVFGSIVGGQVQLDVFNPVRHAVKGSWSRDWLSGLAGTLVSPSRGLFIYCPWAALALLTLPAWASWRPRRAVTTWASAALLPFAGLIASYSVWWGGHCFGPRYWTEAIPLFAIMLAQSLDWACDRAAMSAFAPRKHARRALHAVFALLISWSVAVQAVGAASYPSGWETEPVNIDLQPERLWDWRDTELSRAVALLQRKASAPR